jgi:hypothetical protein
MGDPILDAWGHEFVYSCGEGHAHVRSFGPDGVDGTEDDIED